MSEEEKENDDGLITKMYQEKQKEKGKPMQKVTLLDEQDSELKENEYCLRLPTTIIYKWKIMKY